MFPARCCKLEFPQELVKAALNERQFARYVEYQTDISKVNIKDLDPAFREMVKAHGWQLCPGCGAGVERTQDCGHMTCAICRTEFCYQCGAGWKPRQCNCELWPPGELDRIIAERAPYANAIERARIRHVFERHDEHVHQWKKVWITKKNKLCRSCGWVCNQWYWACDECATNSCGKCAFNRNG
ncbi:hypothetical protein BC830DRAFT_1063687 [Chytriomyces sp. MP71]|nr:hypothetical protein BC830DRAFT_1063687 [Chytriomyces sp. MP71]